MVIFLKELTDGDDKIAQQPKTLCQACRPVFGSCGRKLNQVVFSPALTCVPWHTLALTNEHKQKFKTLIQLL